MASKPIQAKCLCLLWLDIHYHPIYFQASSFVHPLINFLDIGSDSYPDFFFINSTSKN